MNAIDITNQLLQKISLQQFRAHLNRSIDAKGNTTLMWACRNGRHNIVTTLVEKFNMAVNMTNFEGESSLFAAVIGQHHNIASYLIEKGANVNIANLRGETPLHIASALGDVTLVQLLLKFGAWIDADDECGDTPLHFAVRDNRVEVVECLLLQGANCNRLNEDEESPMQLAEIVGTSELRNVFNVITSANSSSLAGESSNDLLRRSQDMDVCSSTSTSPPTDLRTYEHTSWVPIVVTRVSAVRGKDVLTEH